jgi:membrane associated rhomboid family serine protease
VHKGAVADALILFTFILFKDFSCLHAIKRARSGVMVITRRTDVALFNLRMICVLRVSEFMLYPSPNYQRPQPPAVNIPQIILALVGLMLAIHGVREYVLTEQQDLDLIMNFAFIPARLSYYVDPAKMLDVLGSGVGAGADSLHAQLARYFFGNGSLHPWSMITYAFLHGDWMHVGVNSLWLIAFGSPVARRFGAVRFVLFFVVTAIAGVALHYVVHRYDIAPVIGASAAVSGAMGAALRFVFQPEGEDHVLYFASASTQFVHRRKALSLRAVFANRRAVSFMALWFGINFIFGIAAVPLGISEASIAWEAHMGGFIAGLLVFRFFDPVAN